MRTLALKNRCKHEGPIQTFNRIYALYACIYRDIYMSSSYIKQSSTIYNKMISHIILYHLVSTYPMCVNGQPFLYFDPLSPP